MLGQHLHHRLVDLLLRDRDRTVEIVAVARHRRQVEAFLEQPLGELARAIGAKVEEYGCVPWTQPRPSCQHDWLDELVGRAALVALTHRLDRIVRLFAHSSTNRVKGAIRPVPALVAVHRVVAAGDGGDPVGGQLGEIVHGGVRRDVPAVGEGVDPGLLGREAEQGSQVVDVRVDTAVGDEAEQVHLVAALECRDERRILEEGAILDRLVHAHQVLVEDAAGTDRQVADLGVAHLPRRQADRLA